MYILQVIIWLLIKIKKRRLCRLRRWWWWWAQCCLVRCQWSSRHLRLSSSFIIHHHYSSVFSPSSRLSVFHCQDLLVCEAGTTTWRNEDVPSKGADGEAVDGGCCCRLLCRQGRCRWTCCRTALAVMSRTSATRSWGLRKAKSHSINTNNSMQQLQTSLSIMKTSSLQNVCTFYYK